jgi:hypothetical protein
LTENKAVRDEAGRRGRGVVKNHKSECGDLVPERKGLLFEISGGVKDGDGSGSEDGYTIGTK